MCADLAQVQVPVDLPSQAASGGLAATPFLLDRGSPIDTVAPQHGRRPADGGPYGPMPDRGQGRMGWGSRAGVSGGVAAAGAAGLAAPAVWSPARAQARPVRVGCSLSMTGPLSGGVKAGLIGYELWRDDVNKAGGILGRPVELVTYDDQSSSAPVPGIYSKLVDIDKVDILFSPYGANLTAVIMPFVKSRDRFIVGMFGVSNNGRGQARQVLPDRGLGPERLGGMGARLLRSREGERGQEGRDPGGGRRVLQGGRDQRPGDRQGIRNGARLRPDLSAEHDRLLVHPAQRQGGGTGRGLCLLLSAGFGRHRARWSPRSGLGRA